MGEDKMGDDAKKWQKEMVEKKEEKEMVEKLKRAADLAKKLDAGTITPDQQKELDDLMKEVREK